MAESETIAQPTETDSSMHADAGYRFFIQAAGRYKGSPVVQSAFIASQLSDAQDMGQELNASVLGESLLKRRDLLEQIVKITNHAHDAARKEKLNVMERTKWKKFMNRLLEPPRPPVVDMEHAKSTIKGVFTLAQRMSVLSKDELNLLIDEYPETVANNQRDENDERIGEGLLHDKAERMIQSHTDQGE